MYARCLPGAWWIKKMEIASLRNNTADFLIFSKENGGDGIEVRIEDETIWFTQKLMAELFDTTKQNISLHLKKIFDEDELKESSVVKDYLTTAVDGKSYSTKHYNLDAIIAVGYRVNSKRATAFRQWATKVLRDFVIKGYVLDSERLKNGKIFDQNYFDRLLEEIREIRASERQQYQKVTDLFATASDYDVNSLIARRFFATVQNKLHYAVHRHTAAELIMQRADADKQHMGLTTWKNVKKGGKILRSDVLIAKNYLSREEIDTLNRLVSMYLDMAELRAQKRLPMTMDDWEKRLDSFLVFNDMGILQGPGSVSAQEAKEHALGEFEKFRIRQDHEFRNAFDVRIAADRLLDDARKMVKDED